MKVFNDYKWYKIIFSLIKQVFIVLLSFSKSWETKIVKLNNEPCIIRFFLIDLNTFKLKHHPFKTNPDKCNESCNFFHLQKYVFPVKQKM